MKQLFWIFFILTLGFSLFSCKKAPVQVHTQRDLEKLKHELSEEFEESEITFYAPDIQAELNDFIENPDKVMEFKDDRYIPYFNDVSMFPDAYSGHKILVQGQYKRMTYDFGAGKHTVDYLYRETKGCEPGSIITQGFEFLKPASFAKQLKDGDWIEIFGTIAPYEDKDITFLRIKAEKLQILKEPGVLFVE